MNAIQYNLFEIRCEDRTVIVTPLSDLGEFEFEQMVTEAEDALQFLEQSNDKKNVVLDFHNTDYFGSTAMGLFLKLWKRVRERGGRMALCGLSEHEKEVLEVTRLDSLWTICDSTEEALRFVEQD